MYYPCAECDRRFGKQYTEECDATCDYAKAVKEGDRLKKILKSILIDLYEDCAHCKNYPTCKTNTCSNYEKYELDLDAIESDYSDVGL